LRDQGESKVGFVRNPLTVIAVFAGLAEVSATIALPQLSPNAQNVFVWFVMLFPTLLVGLFFFVLWQKHHVLYAPSDFSDEKNFMRHWVPAPETQEGIEQEDEGADGGLGGLQVRSATSASEGRADERKTNYADFRRKREDAQKRVILKLSKKLGLSFATEVALGREIGTRYDGVASAPSGPVMVAVNLLRSMTSGPMSLRRELDRAASLSYRLPAAEMRNAKLILAYVFETEEQFADAEGLRSRMRETRDAANLPIVVELEFYTLESLQKGND